MSTPQQLGLGFETDEPAGVSAPSPLTSPSPLPTLARSPAPARRFRSPIPPSPISPTQPAASSPPPLATPSSSSLPLPTSGSACVSAPAQAPAPTAVANVHADAELHAWAERLDAHPDYRVLRRLVPRLDFGPPTVLPTATAAEGAGAPGGDAPDDRWRTLLVLDTETTGLEAGRDRVIELAVLRVTVDRTTGQPVGAVQVYDGLEDPGQPLPAAIVDITGLTDEQLRGQRLDDDRVAELMRGVDVVVAHNAAFDRPFVERRYPAFAELAWACSWADLNWKALGQGSAKLEALAAAAGWFYDAHRAEADCHALLAVLARPLAAWRKPLPSSSLPAATAQGSSGPAAGPEGATAGPLGAAPSPLPPPPPAEATTSLALLLEQAGRTQFRLQATGAPFEAKDALKARGYRWDGGQRVWATVLRTEAALDDELAWLADAVYGGRATRVRVEALDARLRYAQRPGDPQMWPVGGLAGHRLGPN